MPDFGHHAEIDDPDFTTFRCRGHRIRRHPASRHENDGESTKEMLSYRERRWPIVSVAECPDPFDETIASIRSGSRSTMTGKIRELIDDLESAGFREIPCGDQESNRAGDPLKVGDRFHKWVEWSDQDQVYLRKCPDVMTGIHGDDPVRLFADLCEVVEEVLEHFEKQGRPLPPVRTRPMQEVL